MPENQYKRLPAMHKQITDINAEKDIRVRILGRVIDKQDGMIVIDDGSGTAEVIGENLTAGVDDTVRVFARVIPLEDGFELRAEILQDMNALDLNLFRKIMSR
jgi:hypothetical protein